MINSVSSPLLVFEYGGTARSGKGTIVNHLSNLSGSIATEETGADYRCLTWKLLSSGVLAPSMTKAEVLNTVSTAREDELSAIVAARKEYVANHDGNSTFLYTPEIAQIVPLLAQSPNARQAVKEGFRRRVTAVTEDPSKNILLIDGRNLGELIGEIPEAALVLRTFVTAFSTEAAWREHTRSEANGTPIDFLETTRQIENRNRQDAERTIDPVVPDSRHIDYWREVEPGRTVLETHANRYFDGDQIAAAIDLTTKSELLLLTRHGIGKLAVQTNQQILFDTTYFRQSRDPKQAMLEAATVMFEEAVDAYHEERKWANFA